MTESSQSNDDNEDVAAKRARVDLNDSFYDSDEDEIMLREALQSSSDRTAAETERSTPCTSSTPKPYVLSTSNTTLKGRPLARTPLTSNSRNSNAEEDSLIQSSKPFFRLAKEVKELTDERDLLKGQNLFLEQRLLDKDREIQEHTKKVSELTQKYTEALSEIRDIQQRTDKEILQLRTQLQFQMEQQKAEALRNTGGSLQTENRTPAYVRGQGRTGPWRGVLDKISYRSGCGRGEPAP